MIHTDEYRYPVVTPRGVRCGQCQAHHANADTVRECYRITAAQEATVRAEQAAELAYERHLEDRGYWDARAQDDYEERHGVISFSDAWDMACPERITERECSEAL